MSAARELVVSVGNLISLPDVYFRVREVINDPDSTMSNVAEAVSYDPSITARLLMVANSPFFGMASRVETVTRAVNLLGTKHVHDIVLATSIIRSFYGISNDVMNMDVFWDNSIYCGVVARILANRSNELDSERLFVEGLLRDFGHLIMYLKIPDLAQEALVNSKQQGKELFRVEQELIGFDYAEVGGELLRQWQVPSSLVDAVWYQNEPQKALDYPLEASIINVAGFITAQRYFEQNNEALAPTTCPEAWETAGLSVEDAESVRQEADQFADETVNLFFSKSH